jgi:hypothetical protein
MTTAIMLAKVRTFLDESSASFWTDAEIYAALAHGQIACIDIILTVYKQRYKIDPNHELPNELRVLETNNSAGIAASKINIPAGFIWLVNANWDHDSTGGEKPCRIVSMDRGFNHHIDNTFLAPSATDPIAYVAPEISAGAQSINFLPVYSTTATYTIYYLKYPTAIAVGQEPTLPEGMHNAIVEYATYAMLMKDQRPQEAQAHYNLYSQELKQILGV